MSVRFEAGRANAPVTVAIATHNRAHLIGDALQSCLDQTVRPEQVIVVDDGSSDNTEAVVRGFTSLDIDYVNVGKIGLGNARNLATALCRSKYLCVLDDDDIMLPNRLQDHMISFDAGAQLSHGGWINFNERGELEYRAGKVVTEDVVVYSGAAVTHGACCYEVALLREFPYREELIGGADFDLAVRVIRSGIRCIHTGSYVLLRRRHDANLSLAHGAVQQSVRNLVVGMIDRTRSDSEMLSRRTAGASHKELVNLPSPPLKKIFDALGGLRTSMQVTASVPREATSFFGVLRSLNVGWSCLEVIDSESSLTAAISLGCRPTKNVTTLDSFSAAFRKSGIKPFLSAVRARPDSERGTINTLSPRAGFRLALRSSSLKELYYAHQILALQRTWEWYLAVRQDVVRGRLLPFYYLVSATFKYRQETAPKTPQVEQLRNFIYGQVYLSALLLDQAASE